jgi:hypothetical protein
MELITSHGTRTSTSLSIVVHAGLKEQLLPLLTDSILSSTRITILQLLLVLKLLLTVIKVEIVQVESQTQSMSGHLFMVFHTHPAKITLLITQMMLDLATQSISAKIAHGHPAQLDRPAKRIAGLSLTTRDTMPLPTTDLLENLQ